jgi:hypothetical protein
MNVATNASQEPLEGSKTIHTSAAPTNAHKAVLGCYLQEALKLTLNAVLLYPWMTSRTIAKESICQVRKVLPCLSPESHTPTVQTGKYSEHEEDV